MKKETRLVNGFIKKRSRVQRILIDQDVEGANTLEEAKERVIEIAFDLAKDPVKPTVINPNIDPLDLIAREEKLLRQKERLNRAEKKKNNPKISLEKAFKD